jgi:hypothetical protein
MDNPLRAVDGFTPIETNAIGADAEFTETLSE